MHEKSWYYLSRLVSVVRRNRGDVLQRTNLRERNHECEGHVDVLNRMIRDREIEKFDRDKRDSISLSRGIYKIDY